MTSSLSVIDDHGDESSTDGTQIESSCSLKFVSFNFLHSAALSKSKVDIFNDCDDRHDSATPVNTKSSIPTTPRNTHIDAVSIGISHSRTSLADARRKSVQDLAKDLSNSPTDGHQSYNAREWPPRVLQVSRETLSAVLHTVEALRGPHAYSSDLLEETASMSDLIDVQVTSRKTGENDTHKPKPSIGFATNVKGPRVVIRERIAREARRKAELEQKIILERNRAMEETSKLQERQQSFQTREAANISGGLPGNLSETYEEIPHSSSQAAGHRLASNPQLEKEPENSEISAGCSQSQQSLGGTKQEQTDTTGGDVRGNRFRPSQFERQSKHTQREQTFTSTPSGAQPFTTSTRSSFPHAFERWETLSAHWEGLTSFWIRRLQENSREIERDPLMQQLSRQVTDLSAAGANLFHAVVELQRLRASSERKFQRWFYETRTEQERNQELHATIEKKLQAEIQSREAAVAEAEKMIRLASEKELIEIKRELQISKGEAKRAWEELGRREREDRQRSSSLREGLPTIVGGVQVVPVIPRTSNKSRQTQRPENTSEGSDFSQDNSAHEQDVGSKIESPVAAFDTPESFSRVSESFQPRSPQNVGAPKSILKDSSSPGKTQRLSDTKFDEHAKGTSLHSAKQKSTEIASKSQESDSGEEEEYEIEEEQNLVDEDLGPQPRYASHLNDSHQSELYEDELGRLRQYGEMSDVEYGRGVPVLTGYPHSPASYTMPSMDASDTAEYNELSRQDYSPGHEWSNVPRHHHPTRLSDVIEEDERSRTSTSQVSRSRD